MSKKLSLFALIFGAFLFTDCSKEDANDENVLINIQDEFYIDLWEDLSDGHRTLVIPVKTIQLQECRDYAIAFESEISLSESYRSITLSLNDLIPPADCIEEEAPARAEIGLGGLQNDSYNIRINLKDAVVNHGQLYVTDEYYRLETVTDNGIEVLHSRLMRIPANICWGYVAYENESEAETAENIVKALDDLAAVSNLNEVAEGYDAGYYGYFTLDQSNKISLNEAITSNYHQTFIFRYEDNFTEIEDLVNTECSNHPGLKIMVYNELGEVISCN